MQTIAISFSIVLPMIPARDGEEGITFYRNALEFEVTYLNSDPAQFAIVSREGVKLHPVRQPKQASSDSTSLRIAVERIDTL